MRQRSSCLPLACSGLLPALVVMAVLLPGCPDKKEQPAALSENHGPPPPPRPPEQLFAELNCRACHGPGAMFSAALAHARDKPDETVAMWILDAQKVKPGTAMPTFAEYLSTQEALGLARWIKAGNPVPPAGP